MRYQLRSVWTVALCAAVPVLLSAAACSRASSPTAPSITVNVYAGAGADGPGSAPSSVPAAPYSPTVPPWRWDVPATAYGCSIARPVPALTYDNTPVSVEALSVPAGAYRVTYAPARNTIIAGVFVPDPQLKAGIYALCSWERVR